LEYKDKDKDKITDKIMEYKIFFITEPGLHFSVKF